MGRHRDVTTISPDRVGGGDRTRPRLDGRRTPSSRDLLLGASGFLSHLVVKRVYFATGLSSEFSKPGSGTERKRRKEQETNK